MRFVFGVPARDLPGEYNLELVYSEKKNAYFLNIETIFYFSSVADELSYYTNLLDEFTDYMEKSGFNTNEIITLNDLCFWKVREFRSIESAYAWFKFVVESYVCMYR